MPAATPLRIPFWNAPALPGCIGSDGSESAVKIASCRDGPPLVTSAGWRPAAASAGGVGSKLENPGLKVPVAPSCWVSTQSAPDSTDAATAASVAAWAVAGRAVAVTARVAARAHRAGRLLNMCRAPL